MVTLGVDFAAQDKNTAACKIKWELGSGRVEGVFLRLGDAQLMELFGQVDRIGIDIPFGWPQAFVEGVCAHNMFEALPPAEKKNLCYRRTDLFVAEHVGKQPLSVSSDRIGVPALRAAALFDRLQR